MLPKEHGAYGQLAFPQLTALAAIGSSDASLLWLATLTAAFIGHEPLLVLLGRRGARARRDHARSAARLLAGIAAMGTMAGLAALWTAPPHTRWSFVVPVVPAVAVVMAIARGAEKTTTAEATVATTFAAAAVPTAVTAGGAVQIALAIAIAFWLVFVSATFAIRVIVLRVRGGGEPAAVRQIQVAFVALQLAAWIGLTFAVSDQLLPLVLPLAILPPLVICAVLAAAPPPPTQLRRVGWSMVATMTVTTVVLITGLSS